AVLWRQVQFDFGARGMRQRLAVPDDLDGFQPWTDRFRRYVQPGSRREVKRIAWKLAVDREQQHRTGGDECVTGLQSGHVRVERERAAGVHVETRVADLREPDTAPGEVA